MGEATAGGRWKQALPEARQVLDVDVDELKLRNLYREAEPTHFSQPLTDCRILPIWQQLSASSELAQRKRGVVQFNSENRYGTTYDTQLATRNMHETRTVQAPARTLQQRKPVQNARGVAIVWMRGAMRACARACVCVRVRVRVCACACVCVRARMFCARVCGFLCVLCSCAHAHHIASASSGTVSVGSRLLLSSSACPSRLSS